MTPLQNALSAYAWHGIKNNPFLVDNQAGCCIIALTWANNFIDEWTKDVMRHRSLPELKKFAKMIRSHHELILNYFCAKKGLSSGMAEGFNNKVKLSIRKSYTFRSDKLREIASYHTFGNLPVPEITHRFV